MSPEGSASLPGEDGAANSPTITTPAMTGVGMILGTAAYMSPEQAKGRPADKRSDVWAFSGTSTMRRLTFGGRNLFPIWSPDGQRVAFQSDREGTSASSRSGWTATARLNV